MSCKAHEFLGHDEMPSTAYSGQILMKLVSTKSDASTKPMIAPVPLI
jgi:hypothetical protein